jgi:hypothetical protein
VKGVGPPHRNIYRSILRGQELIIDIGGCYEAVASGKLQVNKCRARTESKEFNHEFHE